MRVNDHPKVNKKMGFIKSTSTFYQQYEYFKLKHTHKHHIYKQISGKINLFYITLPMFDITEKQCVETFSHILCLNF